MEQEEGKRPIDLKALLICRTVARGRIRTSYTRLASEKKGRESHD